MAQSESEVLFCEKIESVTRMLSFSSLFRNFGLHLFREIRLKKRMLASHVTTLSTKSDAFVVLNL